ncbi:MAG: NADH-quinone oxidoreductase subunit M [Chthoniobacterales bacterium]|nr:NADH-quinone oxidoreductase subunit M [Chthoniobacterales bacterium]
MTQVSPLLFLILVPLVASAFIFVGSSARRTALIASLVNLVFVLALFAVFQTGDASYQFVSSTPVIPSLGIALTLGADGLSLIMLLLTALVTVAAVAVARTPDKNAGWFYASLLFISAGGLGAFASIDLFFFYMFHELALIPTFLLIGIWGSGDRQAAAWKATIYLALGSFVLLLGLIGLYLIQPEGSRTFDLRSVISMAGLGVLGDGTWVYLLLLLGFGILVSLFPFHTWAPQAYASAPPPAAMLHAGVLKKFGLYGLIRIASPILPEAVTQFANLLLILLVGNLLYVGYVTISQRKLDWMLGYSSVMHMGYIFLGFAALNVFSITGASLLLFAHGLSIAALFALSGELRERTGTLDLAEFGGLAKPMPFFGLLFGFASFAAIGLPGFVGFPGELLVFFGAFAGGEPLMDSVNGVEIFALNNFQIATVCAVWGVVISAIYMLRAYRRIFFGPVSDRWKGLPEISGVPRVAIVTLLVVMLVTGFFPNLLIRLLASTSLWL